MGVEGCNGKDEQGLRTAAAGVRVSLDYLEKSAALSNKRLLRSPGTPGGEDQSPGGSPLRRGGPGDWFANRGVTTAAPQPPLPRPTAWAGHPRATPLIVTTPVLTVAKPGASPRGTVAAGSPAFRIGRAANAGMLAATATATRRSGEGAGCNGTTSSQAAPLRNTRRRLPSPTAPTRRFTAMACTPRTKAGCRQVALAAALVATLGGARTARSEPALGVRQPATIAAASAAADAVALAVDLQAPPPSAAGAAAAPAEEVAPPPPTTPRRAPAGYRPITDLTADAALPPGLLPDEVEPRSTDAPPSVTPEVFDPRLAGGWADSVYFWSATHLCHGPLYFEEVNLERYGYQCHPALQPVVSGAHFFLTVPTLPYQMTVHPPRECIYTLGHYRPGDRVPWQRHRLPWDSRAAAVEATVAVGLIFLIP